MDTSEEEDEFGSVEWGSGLDAGLIMVGLIGAVLVLGVLSYVWELGTQVGCGLVVVYFVMRYVHREIRSHQYWNRPFDEAELAQIAEIKARLARRDSCNPWGG